MKIFIGYPILDFQEVPDGLTYSQILEFCRNLVDHTSLGYLRNDVEFDIIKEDEEVK